MKLIKVDLTRASEHADRCLRAVRRRSWDSAHYLCKQDWRVFVAIPAILSEPDQTLEPNCQDGSFIYVDPPGKGEIVPVDQLDEMYLIVEK
jgi:hypothetical protein